MESGALVAYYDEKQIVCAICLGTKDSKLRTLTDRDREQNLSRGRVLYASSRIFDPSLARAELINRLKIHNARQRDIQEKLQIAELWELLSSESEQEYSAEFLAELYFPHQPGPDDIIGLLRALNDDRVYFGKNSGRFQPNSLEQVEQNQRRLEREAAHQREIETVAAWMTARWAGADTEPPEAAAFYIDILRDVAIHGSESLKFKQAKELIQILKVSSEDIPFDMLVRLGIWDADEFLLLHQLDPPRVFPAEVVADSNDSISRNDPCATRRDLRDWHTITIDGPLTLDFDDALSLVSLPDGRMALGVHISDVSSFVLPGTPLDMEARARATSIYLPDLRIPMLPESLSDSAASLIAGRDRRALSLVAYIDDANTISDIEIVPSLIRISEKLTYQEANQRLEEGDLLLVRLYQISRALRNQRLADGAIIQNKPEVTIHVAPDKTIHVHRSTGESRSEMLVSELMILANSTQAAALVTAGIPGLFRSQKQPAEPLTSMEDFDPLRFYRQRRLLARAVVSVSAARHFALGHNAYGTFTSPIRRYQDLVNQRQLLSSLLATPPAYSPEQLEEVIAATSDAISRASMLEDQRRWYWLLKWLAPKVGEYFAGVVLDVSSYRARTLITDLMIEVELQTRYPDIFPGQPVNARLVRVDARAGSFRAELVV